MTTAFNTIKLNQNSIKEQVINKWLNKPALLIMYAKLCKNIQEHKATRFQVRTCVPPPPQAFLYQLLDCIKDTSYIKLPWPTAYPTPSRLGMQLWRPHSPRIPWCNLRSGDSRATVPLMSGKSLHQWSRAAIWMTVTPNTHITNIQRYIVRTWFISYQWRSEKLIIINKISPCLSHFGNLLLWLVPPRPPIQQTAVFKSDVDI